MAVRSAGGINWASTDSGQAQLSKSRFCAGLQCPKQLWWRVHEPHAPELEAGPELQAVFDRGHLVGEAARERFPGGVLVDAEHWEVQKKLEQTRCALADRAPVIYEASFLEDGSSCPWTCSSAGGMASAS